MLRTFPLAALICVAALVACNGSKESESGSTPVGEDLDNDGYGSNDDCNDNDAAINPSAMETCDGQDNDCDGEVDEGVSTTWYADLDGDGYGDPANTTDACEKPTGYVPIGNDCNDDSANAWPGNNEVCDGIDNDCDGVVDEDLSSTVYADADGDGHGDPATSQTGCTGAEGWSEVGDDCDDTNAAIYTGAPEVCDSLDNDCDGEVDEESGDSNGWYRDVDGDGYGDPATEEHSCRVPPGAIDLGGDCDDANPAVNPGAAEICDGIDNNCDGAIDDATAVDASTWYLDADGDAYGSAAVSVDACDQPPNFVSSPADCDDANARINPGSPEICDGLDNDCDGIIDDDPVDGDTWYPDLDADNWGDATASIRSCAALAGHVTNDWDCDDANPDEPVIVDALMGSASGDGSGLSPLDTIQGGVDLAIGCVLVKPGTYTEQVDLYGKGLSLRGAEGSAVTIIDPELSTCTYTNPDDCGAVLTMDSGSGVSARIDGFTIRNGTGYATSTVTTDTCGDSVSGYETCSDLVYEYCGGGVYVYGENPDFHDVVLEHNTLPPYTYGAVDTLTEVWMYSMGGGLCAVDAVVKLDDVSIFANSADEGGGIFATDASTVEMLHTYIAENVATDGAGAFFEAATLTAGNSIFACNGATGDGGGLLLESSGSGADLVNVSFYGDSSAAGINRGAAVYGDAYATVTITNSIAQTANEAYTFYGTGSGSFNYDDVYNTFYGAYTLGGAWSGGATTLYVDPGFIAPSCDGDPANDDFHLSPGSPVIDAGKPYPADLDADGTLNDMGAYGGPSGVWD